MDADPSLDEVVELDHCSGVHAVEHDYMNLRIAAIFIILIGSTGGALFPVLARRSKWLHVPKSVFEYVSDNSIASLPRPLTDRVITVLPST